MSSTIIEIKFNNDSRININSLIYPKILTRDVKNQSKIFKLKDKTTSSISILEKQQEELDDKTNNLNNNNIIISEKKKKKKKKRKKKKKSFSLNFKYKLKKNLEGKYNELFDKKKNKIKNLSKSFPKLKYINKNINKDSFLNIPKIDNNTKKNSASNSTKKILNYNEEITKNNNSNEIINMNTNNHTRTFNFKNRSNFLINSKKYSLKKKKKICMTPKPKIILNPGGNTLDSMNGGHSNNYTSKYLIGKALKYNDTLEGGIGEGIDSNVKVNIRGKKNAISASINKTNTNEEKRNNQEKINNNIKYNIETINEIKTDDEKKKKENNNININSNTKRRKTFSNLLKSKSKYIFNETYRKKEELEKRLARIRKSYQENDFNQSLTNMRSYIYLILPGNASYLVKNCMCHRVNWREPFSSVTSLYNFKWQQLSYGIDYNSLGNISNTKQIVNHFENHYAITNKAKISVFKYVPFTIIFQFKDKINFNKNNDIIKTKAQRLEELKLFINNSNKYITKYDDIGKFYNEEKYKQDQIKREEFEKEKIKNLKKALKVEEGITTNSISDNINKIKNTKYISDIKVYSDFFPKVNIINKIPTIIKDKDGNIIAEEIKEKENENEKIQYIGKNTLVEISDTHNSGKNIWIIKAINLNRGMCIRVANSFEEIKKIIEKFKEGVDYSFTEAEIDQPNNILENKNDLDNNKNNDNINTNSKTNGNEEEKNCINNKEEKQKIYYCSRIIIQKYIEKPLLYRGRKCDMRIWVLLTQSMKVYVFKEGHLKTCSVEFNINSNNAFTHITNYSFQKYNNNFQKFEKGNEVPFFEFQKFLDEKYADKNYKLNKDLMNKVKEIITISMRSVKEKINKNNRNYQFELFGYDFMLDEDFNLFLIEINTNPGLEESSPWIKIIVPRMLDDALRLTLDQLFEPKYDFNLNYKNMEDLENLENVFNNLEHNIDPNSLTNYKDKNSANNKNDKAKKIVNNNKKYISPFPVPGYSLDENLWDFVCDLNEKDPNDEFLSIIQEENISSKEQSYRGIKHLLKRKNKTKEKLK